MTWGQLLGIVSAVFGLAANLMLLLILHHMDRRITNLENRNDS